MEAQAPRSTEGFVDLSRNADGQESEDYEVVNQQGFLADNETYRPHNQATETNPLLSDNQEEYLKRAIKTDWELNYQEAAIYVQEGLLYISFNTHPTTINALKIHKIIHQMWFRFLYATASLLLFSLVFMEDPCLWKGVPYWVPPMLELILLCVISVRVILEILWFGPRRFITHKRSVIKTVVIIAMIVCSIVILVTENTANHYVRCLRPIFLLDFLNGVRRFLRLVLQSVTTIAYMLCLMFFILVIYGLIGFYIFNSGENTKIKEYGTIEASIVSQFILMEKSGWEVIFGRVYSCFPLQSIIFFVSYMILQSTLVVKLFLAVITSAFQANEKVKTKKLFQHRQRAAFQAYQLLLSKQRPNGISETRFEGFMKYLKPDMKKHFVHVTFHYLNKSHSGSISQLEFYNIYNALSFSWTLNANYKKVWYKCCRGSCFKIFCYMEWLATRRELDWLLGLVISADFLMLLLVSILYSGKISDWFSVEDNIVKLIRISTGVLLTFYIIEICIKIIGFGPRTYFASLWRWFDFLITILTLILIILDNGVLTGLYVLVLLRPLKGLKLIRPIREVFDTLYTIRDRLTSSVVVMLLLYYFFAVIGMEMFADLTMHSHNISDSGCANQTTLKGDIYLRYISFNSILHSYLTLFILTMGPGWENIMKMYADETNQWIQLYFVTFMIVVMVILAVVFAFILQAFIFRIRLEQELESSDKDELNHEEMTVTVVLSTTSSTSINSEYEESISSQECNEEVLVYHGKKYLTREDWGTILYKHDIPKWIEEMEM